MLAFRLTISPAQATLLRQKLSSAQRRGAFAPVKRILALLAIADRTPASAVATTLAVSAESVRVWVADFLLKGVASVVAKKSPGRPPKLTKAQRRALGEVLDAGPEKAGFAGGCWRSPMIQHLIHETFGVTYSVNYIAELLRNMGFSFQKARFVADRLDDLKREQWLKTTWPAILAEAKRTGAYLLFGDEASFPQWGSLSYTWARRGQQPVVKTSGTRRGYKVFGLIDYFTGRFFAKAHEGKLTSASYEAFLREVLSKTRKKIILIQDRAPYHTSAAMRAFFAERADRLTVHELPSYSPDYNPIEMLWKKIKEKETHLKYFPTFESLKEKVAQALVRFQDASTEILSLFGLYNPAVSAK